MLCRHCYDCRDVNSGLQDCHANARNDNPPQPFLKKGGRNEAFTLAEVLITLGIIGIVAALTMPGLVSHHKKQEIETKLAKFYSNVNQAIKFSEVDNGPKEYWNYGLSSQAFYDTYLAKYLKTIKVSRPADNRFITLYFADGSKATIGYTRCFNLYISKKNTEIAGCGNLTTENQEIKYGKEVFYFMINAKFGIDPAVEWPSDTEHINRPTSWLYSECRNLTYGGKWCTELIRRNGWKIPKDYPLKI